MNLSSSILSLRIMLRFQLSSTMSSFFELYTHTYLYYLLKKIKQFLLIFFFSMPLFVNLNHGTTLEPSPLKKIVLVDFVSFIKKGGS